uniref:Uncharacterized protein n=1 Tax=Strombidium rassoulzadegani TaxID=1082188 RepID=A0A7S3FUZ5_9SPIT
MDDVLELGGLGEELKDLSHLQGLVASSLGVFFGGDEEVGANDALHALDLQVALTRYSRECGRREAALILVEDEEARFNEVSHCLLHQLTQEVVEVLGSPPSNLVVVRISHHSAVHEGGGDPVDRLLDGGDAAGHDLSHHAVVNTIGQIRLEREGLLDELRKVLLLGGVAHDHELAQGSTLARSA